MMGTETDGRRTKPIFELMLLHLPMQMSHVQRLNAGPVQNLGTTTGLVDQVGKPAHLGSSDMKTQVLLAVQQLCAAENFLALA